MYFAHDELIKDKKTDKHQAHDNSKAKTDVNGSKNNSNMTLKQEIPIESIILIIYNHRHKHLATDTSIKQKTMENRINSNYECIYYNGDCYNKHVIK